MGGTKGNCLGTRHESHFSDNSWLNKIPYNYICISGEKWNGNSCLTRLNSVECKRYICLVEHPVYSSAHLLCGVLCFDKSFHDTSHLSFKKRSCSCTQCLLCLEPPERLQVASACLCASLSPSSNLHKSALMRFWGCTHCDVGPDVSVCSCTCLCERHNSHVTAVPFSKIKHPYLHIVCLRHARLEAV